MRAMKSIWEGLKEGKGMREDVIMLISKVKDTTLKYKK